MAGLIGRSYALIADAVESLADVVSSVVVWHGLNIAARPADENHPYGHGRAETLSALIVALIIIVAGLGIASEAVREIIHPQYTPASFTLWVLLGVVLVKEVLFRRMRSVALDTGSGAVFSDAWHQRSDAITSATAAVGLGIVVFGGERYAAAEDWAALLASGVILFNGVRLSIAPVRELMDTQPTEVVDHARKVAGKVSGVEIVEKVLARKSGMRYLVDMHIEVDSDMSVYRAHAISHDVKEAILRDIPKVLDVLIHIEPHKRDMQSASVHSEPTGSCD
jgi:cation diffusion facilitator family transporter